MRPDQYGQVAFSFLRWTLFQPAGTVFVQDTGYQRLIGNTFFQCPHLNGVQIFLRDADVDPLIFLESGFGIIAKSVAFTFLIRNRYPFMICDQYRIVAWFMRIAASKRADCSDQAVFYSALSVPCWLSRYSRARQE